MPFELSVNVLTASYWPQAIAAASPCSFNGQLSEATTMYQKYYDSRHSGRRLTWQGNLGTADVRVRFKARAHDINVSTHALVVLLLFENVQSDEVLSYGDIKSATDLSDSDLVRTLQSLACGKFRVLTKNPKGRDVNPSDTFAFNEGFQCPLARFKIMQVASKVENTKEREETQEQVDEERKHMVEACIVRIMKNRKTMGHNDLISEVAHQLSTRFNPSMPMIKKRIEGLIDVSGRVDSVVWQQEADRAEGVFREGWRYWDVPVSGVKIGVRPAVTGVCLSEVPCVFTIDRRVSRFVLLVICTFVCIPHHRIATWAATGNLGNVDSLSECRSLGRFTRGFS